MWNVNSRLLSPLAVRERERNRNPPSPNNERRRFFFFFFFFLLSFSSSSPSASRGRHEEREREVPSQMGPSDLHKASALLHSHRHSVASLINRARAFHAHAYRLLRAQRTSAHRGDTEAPRMPCCANNTTAHVRDISFYYYPSVRSLALSTSPLLLPSQLLSCWIPRSLLPFPASNPFFFFHQRYYFSSSPQVSPFALALPFASLLLFFFFFCNRDRIERVKILYPLSSLSNASRGGEKIEEKRRFLPLFPPQPAVPSGSIYNAHALALEMGTRSYEVGTTCVKSHYTRNDT